MHPSEWLINEPPRAARATLVLAPGAGGAMDSHPLSFIADSLMRENIRVVRFELPYMRLLRTEGRRKAPDPPEVLMQAWREVIEQLGGGAGLVIGGRSLGGRIASLVADEAGARGLVCLGYPFHPPGKPRQLRTRHLALLRTRTLIVQGERDPFGTPEEVAGYMLSDRIRIAWIADGDHSFKPRRQSGRSERQNLEKVVSLIVGFIAGPPSR